MTILARQDNKQWSLTTRLIWRLTLVGLCAILLTAGGVAWRTLATLSDLDDAAMQQQVQFLARHMPDLPPDKPFTMPASVVNRFRFSDDDTLFLILDSKGQMLSTSDSVEANAVRPLLPQPLRSGYIQLPATLGYPRGMLGFSALARGRIVVVVQGRAEASAIVDGLTTQFLGIALWLLLPLGLLMAGVSVVTLRRGLRPLTRAAQAAAAIQSSDTDSRLPTEGLPREIHPLVSAVNDALNRLEHTIAVQRSFMAEAAHGLRTPLAVLAARIDDMAEMGGVEGLRHDIDRMSRLVAQLLSMARLESLPLDISEIFDLYEVAREAIASLAPLAVNKGVELALVGEAPLNIIGNKAAIFVAIVNLVENALGFAPPSTLVEVVLHSPATILVRDCGPGIAPGDEERLLQPFVRGANAKKGGAGLGLAIVLAIATAHRGQLSLTMRQNCGAEVCLTLNADSKS